MGGAGERPGGIVVVGGGLVGSLLAVFLARRGFEVTLYERRADPRSASRDSGRSINLVVTSRGIHALRQMGLDAAAMRLTVSVAGRMMHSVEGQRTYQPYGRDASECNHSISRAELNRFLLTEAERAGARIRFAMPLVAADPATGSLTFARADGRQEVVEAPVVFGADGAASTVRAALTRRAGYEESIAMLEYGYKELEIPPAEGGGYRIEPDALHIWPRGRLMLMALPNLDGSFTGTLYLPHRGAQSFESLDTEERLLELFAKQFPDAVPLLPALTREFFENPTGELGTVRCAPWHLDGRAALVGDAAHAIVPFFGQGMNCGFEDCTVLDELIERHGDDWSAVFSEYGRRRKPDADAIADMALDNFVEMRDRVADAAFLLRKQVEHRLEDEMPDRYRSRYSMVTYSLIPYAVAREAGRIQQGILDELCRDLRSVEQLDLARARTLIEQRLTPFFRTNAVDLDY